MTSVRHWFAATAGGLPRAFWHLWTVTLVNKLGSFVIIYMTLYLSVVRDFSPTTIGVLLGIEGAGSILGTQVAGVLADRWGRRRTLLLSNALGVATLVVLGLVTSLPAIATLMFALGAALNMARPAFSAMIADLIAPTDRVRAYTLNYWAINLGFSAAALLAGLVAGYDYRLIFFINAAAIATTGILVWFKVPETRPAHSAVPDSPRGAQPRGSLRIILGDRVFLAFVGLTFLPAVLMSSMEALLPLQITGAAGLTEQEYGWIIATNGILIVVGQLFIPRLVEGRRRSRVLALACLFWAVGVGAIGLAGSVVAFMATVAVWTVGEMLQTPANSATIADLAPADMRGRYQAAFSLAFQGATLFAPALGGLGLQHLGNGWWLVAFGIGVAAAAGNLAAEPSRERRLAAVYTAQRSEATESGATPDPPAAGDDTGELATAGR